MDLLWTLMVWNRKLKRRLPAWMLRVIRDQVECLGVLWRGKYYGQFGEDAVLQNLLRKVAWGHAGQSPAEGGRGFYVDVGAFAPIQHSNTYWFYKRGWRGINIDAAPGSMRIFNRIRPRDTNLELAISNQEGELTYISWGTPNVGNTLSREVAEKLARGSGQPPQELRVKARTLEHVLDEHLPPGQNFIFLTVDVENHNLEVLKSNNWSKYKPNFVLAEADEGQENLEAIASSEMAAFMRKCGYTICGWVKPTIFFESDGIKQDA